MQLAATMFVAPVFAQDGDNGRLAKGLQYGLEMQASLSEGKTPLWMNANKYGLSSLEESNGYMRAMVCRSLKEDSMRRWGIGYGADVVLPVHYTSNFIIQQAYADMRWQKVLLSIGSKERPMELKDGELSTGSQTFGINARPVPQVRFEIPDYLTLPGMRHWVHVKGHVAFGKMTDENWQHDFTQRKTRYADGTLYNSKAGYLMIGKKDGRLRLEVGLEMAALFGGTAHGVLTSDGTVQTIQCGNSIKDFIHALVPGGNLEGQTVYLNVAGNHLGSWVGRLSYHSDDYMVSAYFDKYFEDHSAMFMLDYDGYGQGNNWDKREDNRFVLYDMKDIMLGGELVMKHARWLNKVVVEYIYTKYQSGPIYHDHTKTIPDHLGGNDNYYNHYVYPGWQHWGQVMGNPLYRSPIYNTNGEIMIENNRFTAWHLGFSGNPARRLHYRVLATVQNGLGTYIKPYNRKHHNLSVLMQAEYGFAGKWRDWSIECGCGFDNGSILGHNKGIQLKVKKTGLLGR